MYFGEFSTVTYIILHDNEYMYDILHWQITSASISSFSRPEVKGELVKLIKYPIYFEYSDGVIARVYTSEVESIFCANVKKGLLSLFQVQETEGQRDEVINPGNPSWPLCCTCTFTIYSIIFVRNSPRSLNFPKSFVFWTYSFLDLDLEILYDSFHSPNLSSTG